MAQSGGLVVLSNRLPVTVRRQRGQLFAEPSSGGLVTALDPGLRSRGGTWVGWPGTPLKPGESLPALDLGYEIATVPISPTEVKRYYHGLSNRALWPLFHLLPGRARFERREWEAYEAVNTRFAECADAVAGADDLIWVHDYHLTRVPIALRERRPDARLAFFNHIPFPPYDVFRIFPWYRELLAGLLACDLIGFHTAGYAANFLDCAERLLGARVDRATGRIERGNRTVQVGAFPLGIDYAGFAAATRALPPREETGERQLVLGVDRLDYTKGIPERIAAFERLLELHPEHREQVTLLQLAVPSRGPIAEYQALKREIDEIVGRVNGRFSTRRWTPVQYLHRSVSRERLVAMYRDADVALVTPLRDGMNLVAKEFVACQTDAPGVLVLSHMAGAAESMFEALGVNPYNTDGVADTLHRALSMEPAQRADRMRALQRRERNNDVTRWLEDFLRAAREPRQPLPPPKGADFESWLGPFLRERPLALFLDYDGTLAEIAERPDLATLAPAARAALTACVARADTDVTIVSGRALADVSALAEVPGLTFAGNHGLEIAGPEIEPYLHEDVAHFTKRAKGLARSLGRIRNGGVMVEEKGASLTLHYRQANPAHHARIAARAREIIGEAGFQPRDALCAVEARPPIGWDKGHAVLWILRNRYGPGWSEQVRVLYVGDDDTDEDAFRVLSGLGISFRVGPADRPTLATRQLANPAGVTELCVWLAARPRALRA